MARRSPSGDKSAGFTVAELLVVLLIIGLIAAIAVPNISGTVNRAEETALRQNLTVMRRAIDDYFADKGRYPDDLQILVAEKYLRFIPDDPVSDKEQDWFIVTADGGGIIDVKSRSGEIGSNDEPYKNW